jgi:hypothetical protein
MLLHNHVFLYSFIKVFKKQLITKIGNLDFIKIKNFCHKINIERVIRDTIDWEKILSVHRYNRGLM